MNSSPAHRRTSEAPLKFLKKSQHNTAIAMLVFILVGCDRDQSAMKAKIAGAKMSTSANSQPLLGGNKQNVNTGNIDVWRISAWTDGSLFRPGSSIDVYVEIMAPDNREPASFSVKIRAAGIGGPRDALMLALTPDQYKPHESKPNTYVARIDDCFGSDFRLASSKVLNPGHHFLAIRIADDGGREFTATMAVEVYQH